MGTITINPDDLAATRTALGLTIGSDVLAPSGNGANLTSLNASALASGTVPAARLGTGTANSTTFLAGDQTYKTVSSGLTLLATGTASNSASIEFTSVMTSDYLTYLFIFQSLQPAVAANTWRASLSDDNGSSYSITHRYITTAAFYSGTVSYTHLRAHET